MMNENQVISTSRRKPGTADPGGWHASALGIHVRRVVWVEGEQSTLALRCMPNSPFPLGACARLESSSWLQVSLWPGEKGKARCGETGKGFAFRAPWARWHLNWALKDVW